MSIRNELTSELATELLDSSKNKVQADPKELAEIVLNFHSALRPLEVEASKRRARFQTAGGSSNYWKPSDER